MPCRQACRCRHGELLTCDVAHTHRDDVVGTPLCARCYDYAGAVLHNAHAAELWRRTTIYIARQLATALGLSRSACAKVLRLEHCKVAEFQRRGLVHFHALVRADGPEGSTPPIDADVLARACRAAVRSVEMSHLRGTTRWGSEIDVQVLEREARTAHVATYVAKYATKEPAMHPGLLSRILSEADLRSRHLPAHLHTMVATSWSLGGVPELRSLGLRRHAHHLGYTGHYLTKSRRYSTTFGALREARIVWNQQRNGDASAPETTTRRLKAVGRGWSNDGEALFAAAKARQAAEEKKEADFAWYTRCE